MPAAPELTVAGVVAWLVLGGGGRRGGVLLGLMVRNNQILWEAY